MKEKIKIELHLVYVVELIGELPEGVLRKSIVLIDENTPIQDLQELYDNDFVKVRQATLQEFLFWSTQFANPCSYEGFKQWNAKNLN